LREELLGLGARRRDLGGDCEERRRVSGMRGRELDELAMGGRRNPRADTHDIYRVECAGVADELGYDEREVFALWQQIAFAREWCGEPRGVAEWLAMQNVKWALDRRGRAPD